MLKYQQCFEGHAERARVAVSLRSAPADSPDGVVAAGLGSLHDRHPLVVVAEEGEVEVGAAAVRLGADGQLAQQAAHRLRVPAVLGVHDGVFEPGGQRQHVARSLAHVTR